jgi:hypothetical protein
MKYIFNQFQGLGDILFCEPIAKKLWKNGENEIFWPINSEFIWLKEYFPYINFVDMNYFVFNYESTHFGIIKNDIFSIPLRFANPIVRKLKLNDYSQNYHCMLDKYRLLDLPLDMWKTMTWKRNHVKENELFQHLIKKEKYILVNTFFSGGEIDITIDNPQNYQIVNMKKEKGYTLLDWAKLIENATEIHTVSTSNLFLIETLPIKAENVFLYLRKPNEKDFDGISEFVNKNFILTN